MSEVTKKLNIPERYHTLLILPKNGSFSTMRTLESLRKLLFPSEEEVKKYEIKPDENKITWNKEALVSIEMVFSEQMISIISDACKKLDESDSLDQNTYRIYELFIGGE